MAILCRVCDGAGCLLEDPCPLCDGVPGWPECDQFDDQIVDTTLEPTNCENSDVLENPTQVLVDNVADAAYGDALGPLESPPAMTQDHAEASIPDGSAEDTDSIDPAEEASAEDIEGSTAIEIQAIEIQEGASGHQDAEDGAATEAENEGLFDQELLNLQSNVVSETREDQVASLPQIGASQWLERSETREDQVASLPQIGALQWLERSETREDQAASLPQIGASQWLERSETREDQVASLPEVGASQWLERAAADALSEQQQQQEQEQEQVQEREQERERQPPSPQRLPPQLPQPPPTQQNDEHASMNLVVLSGGSFSFAIIMPVQAPIRPQFSEEEVAKMGTTWTHGRAEDLPSLPVAARTICRHGECEPSHDTCGICLQPFDVDEKLTALPCAAGGCGSIWHLSCAHQWFNQAASPSCPLCRAEAVHSEASTSTQTRTSSSAGTLMGSIRRPDGGGESGRHIMSFLLQAMMSSGTSPFAGETPGLAVTLA